LKKKIAAAAILMCAVMILVAGAPLVTADTHHIVRGALGVRQSIVTWEYTPVDTGIWTGHVVNSGLKWIVVNVTDVTTGATGCYILQQRFRFAATGDTLDTDGVMMAKNHKYQITVTPSGPKGTSCTVEDVFSTGNPPVAVFTYSLGLDGATVTVDGSSSYDPSLGQTIQAWGWEWGDGSASSTGVTASHTYTASGIYTITLTVLSSTGMTGSSNQDVQINLQDQLPIPMFTAIATSLTVNFDASASTDDFGIVSYDWAFGDSTTGTGKLATHTYAVQGTYPVTLTVTDTATQTASLTKDVLVVDNPPVASFTATVSGYSVSVTSTSTDDFGIASWSWNWGDGSPAGTGATATHTYTGITSVAGLTKTITLTVTDTIGQTNSVTHMITLQDNAPVAAFSISYNGYTVSFDASASTDDHGIVSSAWDFGDGSTGTGQTTTHTYVALPQTYNVVLTVTDTVGQKGTLTQKVSFVDQTPVASFTSVVSGYTVTVTSTSTDDHGIASLSWNWGDGSAAGTGATATHTYTTATVPPLTKTITLTVTDTIGQTNSVSHDVTLQDNLPVASFTSVVSGYTVTVTSTSTDDHGINSYSWVWGDGSAAGTGATATHTYTGITSVAGLTKTITLTVTDTVGQTKSASNTVTLQDNAPVASFTYTKSGLSVTVTSTSTDDHGINSYAWSWGDSTAGGTGATATHTYTTSGTYTVMLTVTDTIGQPNSVSQPVTVGGNPPVASFIATVSGYTVSVDASASTSAVGIASYSWNWGDGSAAGTGVTATHTYTGITSIAALTKIITLTVTDTVGQTGLASKTVTLQDNLPVAAFTSAVSGYTVTVTSTSTDDHGINSYSWVWGDGSAAGTGATATHTYTTATVPPLTKTITLTVTDTVGQTNSVSHDVNLQDNAPVASFTSVVSGYTVTVTSTSTDDHGIASSSWDWGDGSAAGTGATATHTYTGITSVAGLTKTITLTVTDTVGQTNSASKTVTLQDNLPVAAFTSAVSGYTVTVTSTSTDDHGINSYSWVWGDASAAGTGATATHTYTGITSVAGLTKTITLTVTDTIGQTNPVSHDVNLQDNLPVAAFTSAVSGYTVTVTSTSTDDHGINSYSWVWGDASAAGTGSTATHTYTGITSVAGLTKTITLTVTDTIGQTKSASNTVTLVDNLPVAAFTIAPPTGLTVSVDASASTDDHGIASWSWNWGDGSAAGTGATATHTYGTPGAKTITLTVTDTIGQTNPVSHGVTVGGGPVAAFTATVAANGYVVSVDASASTGTGTLSYAWDWGDLVTQAGVTATHTYVTNGVYTITLTVKDSTGQTSVSHDVTISGVPIPPNACLIYGTTWASDGVTPLGGCTITVTDVRTGTTLIGTVSLEDGTYYADISPLFQSAGDTIIVHATGPAGQTGSGTGVLVGTPYLGIDVILI
jgi:PKD repeat protein